MDTLPHELIQIIFGYIQKITGKRQFLKTCNTYNNITKNLMEVVELEFNPKYFGKIDEYCAEKFILELCHDSYFDLIPFSYIKEKNNILLKVAAIYNNIELLKIAKKEGYWFDNNICKWAAEAGSIEIIDWIFVQDNLDASKESINGNVLPPELTSIAAENGHLEFIKILYFVGCEWDYDVTYHAAKNGHLDIIKYAMENGCGWDGDTCAGAAEKGYLDILIWAHQNRHFNQQDICYFAIQHGHEHILKWMKENGYKIIVYNGVVPPLNIANFLMKNEHVII